MIEFRFDSITFSDGTEVTLPPTGVVLLVGPNNSGKSQALRDLLASQRSQSGYSPRVVMHVETHCSGSIEDARLWAEENLVTRTSSGVTRTLIPEWGEVAVDDFVRNWRNPLGPLTGVMIQLADGTTRLTAGNTQPSVDLRTQFPTHPIQRAADRPELESALDEMGQRAFGLGVTVDRYAGAVVSLRMGKRPEFDHVNGAPTRSYLDQLSGLVRLDEQGDGVRGFMGLMMHLIAGSHQVVLVDEPEAFLHPPQARLLGRLLAERASSQQVFVATHSSDVLQGALESGQPVTIVRLRREGNVNHAAVLDHESVRALWADSLLRYSGILDGLFHDAVVLCESDSDCRFYAATRDELGPEVVGAARRPALQFAHCGGKHRLATAISALRAVSVPVVVIADFDILREVATVEKVFSQLGGDWSNLAAQHGVLSAALSAGRSLSKTQVETAFRERLSLAGTVLTREDVEALRALLRSETGWDKVKMSGVAGVPGGDPSAAAGELLNTLERYGLFVVSVGELERWVPAIAGHGPSWVSSALDSEAHKSPSADLAAFLGRVESCARQLAGLDS